MTQERPPQATPAYASLRLRLLALLDAGDLDAALQAGLMDYPAVAGEPEDAALLAAQAQLRAAWAARERHRARDQRLARLADERQARRGWRSLAPSLDAQGDPIGVGLRTYPKVEIVAVVRCEHGP